MKKILLTTTVLFFSLAGMKLYAQDEIAEVQKEWGKDKKELVRFGMELMPADSIKFWPVYNRYEKERQKLGRDRIIILQEYADHFADLSNAKADELVNRIFKNDASLAKLMQQYYQTMKTTLNAKQAAKFLQIETYINSFLRSLIQEEIPIIGELDHMKKSL